MIMNMFKEMKEGTSSRMNSQENKTTELNKEVNVGCENRTIKKPAILNKNQNEMQK